MRFLGLALLLGACGDGGIDLCRPHDSGGPPSVESIANVHVTETSDDEGRPLLTFVDANFAASRLVKFDETAAAGDCRLSRLNDCCTDGCPSYCLDDGACMGLLSPGPTVGLLTITGLSREVSVSPVDGVYSDGSDAVFQDGVDVGASAPGGSGFPSFTISVSPPQRLVVTNRDQLQVADDHDLVVEWVPSGDPEARILLQLYTRFDRGYDRVSPVYLECDAADSGSLVVPQSLIAEYADRKNWNCDDDACFISRMTRYTQSTAQAGETPLELRAASEVGLYLPL